MSRAGVFLIAAGVLSVVALIAGAPQLTRSSKADPRSNRCVKIAGSVFQVDAPMRISSTADARTFPDAPELAWRNTLSVEGWINVDASSHPWRRIVGKQLDDSERDSAWVFGLGSHGGLYFGLFQDGTQRFIDSTRTLSPGDWHHVAATWDGATMTTWLDGEVDRQLAFSGPIQRSSQPVIVGSGTTSRYALEGRLDRLALYDRALSASEIESIAAAGTCNER